MVDTIRVTPSCVLNPCTISLKLNTLLVVVFVASATVPRMLCGCPSTVCWAFCSIAVGDEDAGNRKMFRSVLRWSRARDVIKAVQKIFTDYSHCCWWSQLGKVLVHEVRSELAAWRGDGQMKEKRKENIKSRGYLVVLTYKNSASVWIGLEPDWLSLNCGHATVQKCELPSDKPDCGTTCSVWACLNCGCFSCCDKGWVCFLGTHLTP